MKIILTGTASGVPVSARRCASMIVQHGSASLLFDAGEGVTAGLLELGLDPASIAAVWISHTHADHVSGLPLLLQAMHLTGRSEPLDIHIPPERETWFRQWLHGMYIFEEKWSFPLQLRAFDADGASVLGMRITSIPNSHLDRVRSLAASHGVPAQAYSFRLSSGSAVVIVSSDLGSLGDIEREAEDATILVVDSTHVDVEEIHALAERYPLLQVVCTHIPPELDDELPALQRRSRDETGGRITYAYDGLEISIGRAA